MPGFVQRIMQWRPVRAYQHYAEVKGPIFAQGMTLSAFYSVFAALFIAFAIFAMVLGDNAELRERIISSIAGAIPGLIDTGNGNGGAIQVDELIGSSILGWGAAVAAISILLTAINWIAVSREGFRAVFTLDNPRTNPVLLKLGDLGVAVGIGVLVLVSAGVLVLTSSILEDWLGIGGVGWAVGIVVQLALDTCIVALLYRFGGRIKMPAKQLFGAAFLCAIGFFILKQLVTQLLGGIENNPLLASVATTVAILIWLGFTNQILLIALSFIAVGSTGTAYTRLEHVETADERKIEAAKAARKKAAEELRDRERPGDRRQVVRMFKKLSKRR